uniref:Uncharacterized protein n=1 Tax=Proboscia inermis TaxID=420281 RepID=A0A7S0CKS3_9STRA|mmetsp:Transcript_543/g.586  ORF Transcript_543/g.586 Transcript_543/m.586 type:complete len:136 (+) Transcript_543:3-410(+)
MNNGFHSGEGFHFVIIDPISGETIYRGRTSADVAGRARTERQSAARALVRRRQYQSAARRRVSRADDCRDGTASLRHAGDRGDGAARRTAAVARGDGNQSGRRACFTRTNFDEIKTHLCVHVTSLNISIVKLSVI